MLHHGTRILFVRTGTIFKEDPLEHLDALFEQGHKKVAFAKFGKPFGAAMVKRLYQYGPDVYLALLRARKDKDFAALYPIASVSNALPAGAVYPDYYRRHANYISAWVTLTPPGEEKAVSLDDLIVASSRNKIRAALSTSMASHYLCAFTP